MSSVPIGENLILIQRGLTTSSTAIFIPFITQELFQTGEALYYGLNALSNNMILCDRKKLKNPKGLYCKGRASARKIQVKRSFAAQMDKTPKKKGGHPTFETSACGTVKIFFPNSREKGSASGFNFLLSVKEDYRICSHPIISFQESEGGSQAYFTLRRRVKQSEKELVVCGQSLAM